MSDREKKEMYEDNTATPIGSIIPIVMKDIIARAKAREGENKHEEPANISAQ